MKLLVVCSLLIYLTLCSYFFAFVLCGDRSNAAVLDGFIALALSQAFAIFIIITVWKIKK